MPQMALVHFNNIMIDNNMKQVLNCDATTVDLAKFYVKRTI